ncbi:MAG: cation:proton antiporter [Acidobacteriales bacterium]|nr:cation:proton antiporter [Terriglobales bacterium]
MSNSEIGTLIFLLFLLLASAHLLGYVFVRLRQPRVIGEILAGVLLGPSVLGHFSSQVSANAKHYDMVLNFVYWLGLMLLMFISGCETRKLFSREDRREVSWLVIVGTGLPFVIGLMAAPWLPLESLMGRVDVRSAMILVLGIAVAVTSIPVISRIFHDLGILHTRFARLVLGVAVIEDIILWAILAVATALAGAAALSKQTIALHVLLTVIYFLVGLLLAPSLLKRVNRARWNIVAHASPVGYILLVLFAYAAVAAVMDVSLVFAAFLAGFAVVRDRELFAEALHSIHNFSFALFIPIYFAVVGYKLDLTRSFSLQMLLIFLLATCAIKVFSVGLGSRLAGFRGLDLANLAIATNARGGPGIVLASVAYDAGIINAAFYTTLVLTAVLTSQIAGAWLEFVLKRGWPLLSTEPLTQKPKPETVADTPVAA